MKEKWLQMSPAEKAAAKENARAKWDAMTPDEQAAAKRRFAEKYPQAADKIVNEKDAQAVALGYVSDAANANKSKYKDYAAGQRCSSCALYQGKESDAAAGCALFPASRSPAWDGAARMRRRPDQDANECRSPTCPIPSDLLGVATQPEVGPSVGVPRGYCEHFGGFGTRRFPGASLSTGTWCVRHHRRLLLLHAIAWYGRRRYRPWSSAG